jgi:hypothetical protein
MKATTATVLATRCRIRCSGRVRRHVDLSSDSKSVVVVDVSASQVRLLLVAGIGQLGLSAGQLRSCVGHGSTQKSRRHRPAALINARCCARKGYLLLLLLRDIEQCPTAPMAVDFQTERRADLR